MATQKTPERIKLTTSRAGHRVEKDKDGKDRVVGEYSQPTGTELGVPDDVSAKEAASLLNAGQAVVM